VWEQRDGLVDVRPFAPLAPDVRAGLDVAAARVGGTGVRVRELA
jgi:hypothetical protein